MNEIIALQKYENEAQLAKELIRGLVHIMGEITTSCYVDFQKIVREVISEIGYTRAKL